jgi:CheY-like chemotaxis protein
LLRASDLVVLDYWMPDMKGLAVASRLRKIDPDVPILMLSGFREIGGEGLGLVDRWLLKGETNPDDLLDTVLELLGRRERGTPAT